MLWLETELKTFHNIFVCAAFPTFALDSFDEIAVGVAAWSIEHEIAQTTLRMRDGSMWMPMRMGMSTTNVLGLAT